MEPRFAERFGALVLTRGWHCLPPDLISEYGWKDMRWVPGSPWDTYEARVNAHIEEIHQIVDWPRVRESDFEIGWWDKFVGTFRSAVLTQLVKVTFPLTVPRHGLDDLLWAAELSLSEAIGAVCSDMVIKNK